MLIPARVTGPFSEHCILLLLLTVLETETEECPPGSYGAKCSSQCSDYCLNKTCHHETGTCQSCTHGRVKPTCEACPRHYFGPNCTLECPENCKRDICDAASGTCSNCNYGYSGEKCEIRTKYFYIAIKILLLIAVALIVCCCKILRSRKSQQKEIKQVGEVQERK